jgi:phosphatidylglycerol---prolipoprotein diacylglyceryl transferase
MLVHTVFDLLGWLTAALIGVIVGRLNLLGPATSRTPFTDPGYFIALGLGALMGAIFVGSLNLNLAGAFALGHSIAGGIIGGIVGVEIYKWASGIRGSTGRGFVAPLAAGIAVGRLGCFFSGLPDYTYGIPTTLPWGVDFGDGVKRHPTQLYEFCFHLSAAFVLAGLQKHGIFRGQLIKLYIIAYLVFRFFTEFIRPEPRGWLDLTIYQWCAVAMLPVFIFLWWRDRRLMLLRT